MTKATDLIAAERERQVTAEGYDAEHDAGHAAELGAAAACYAWARANNLRMVKMGAPAEVATHYLDGGVPGMWPWDRGYWKPTGDSVRDFVKAGALIAAAIDSLLASSEVSL